MIYSDVTGEREKGVMSGEASNGWSKVEYRSVCFNGGCRFTVVAKCELRVSAGK